MVKEAFYPVDALLERKVSALSRVYIDNGESFDNISFYKIIKEYERNLRETKRHIKRWHN